MTPDVNAFETALKDVLAQKCCWDVTVRKNTTNNILNEAIKNSDEILWVGHGERPTAGNPSPLGTADWFVPTAPAVDWTTGRPNVFVSSCYGYTIAATLFADRGIIAVGPNNTRNRRTTQQSIVWYATEVLKWYKKKCDRDGPFSPPKKLSILIGPR